MVAQTGTGRVVLPQVLLLHPLTFTALLQVHFTALALLALAQLVLLMKFVGPLSVMLVHMLPGALLLMVMA